MAIGKKTGGRIKGTPNKVTQDLMGMAQKYTEDALNTLVTITNQSDAPPSARVAAANAILDRAHGKPTQAITGADGSELIVPMLQIVMSGQENKDEDAV